MFHALTSALLAEVNLQPHEDVLDVGCGSGGLTRAAAQLGRSAVGVDISQAQVDRALQMSAAANRVRFLCSDAECLGAAVQADVVISQLGVMFFRDPVAAFSRLRFARRLSFVTWQPRAGCQHCTVPAEALARWLTPPPASAAGQPGMRSLSDPEEILTVLRQAGWEHAAVRPLCVPVWMGTDADDAAGFVLAEVEADGNLGRVPYDEARTALRTHLRPYQEQRGVYLEAACWLVTAHNRQQRMVPAKQRG